MVWRDRHGRGAAHHQPAAVRGPARIYRQPCRGPGPPLRPRLRAAGREDEAQVDDDRAICLLRPAGGLERGHFASPTGWRRTTAIIEWVDGDERDPCGLCYTSGTTGNPKGVLYEHRSTMLHTLAEATPDIFNLSASARSCCRSCRCSTPTPGACPGRRRWSAASWCCRPTIDPSRMCRAVPRGAGDPFGRRADHLADHDRAYRADRRGTGRPQAGDHRRIGRAAGDDPVVPRARNRGRPRLGHDRNLADRHLRLAAAGLGRL